MARSLVVGAPMSSAMGEADAGAVTLIIESCPSIFRFWRSGNVGDVHGHVLSFEVFLKDRVCRGCWEAGSICC